MNRRVVMGILVVLALIVGALAVGGLGYQLGITQNLAANPQLVGPQGSGGVAPYVYAPFFFRPWGWGFGFGFLQCLFPLLIFLGIFLLIRALFWGGRGWRRGWYGHGMGPGGEDFGPGGQGVPPMFAEWHKRAHGEQTPGGQQPSGQ